MLDDHFDEIARDPEKLDDFERKLGIPLSYAQRAVEPYSHKIKGHDKDEDKKKADEAAQYIEKIRNEADDIKER